MCYWLIHEKELLESFLVLHLEDIDFRICRYFCNVFAPAKVLRATSGVTSIWLRARDGHCVTIVVENELGLSYFLPPSILALGTSNILDTFRNCIRSLADLFSHTII